MWPACYIRLIFDRTRWWRSPMRRSGVSHRTQDSSLSTRAPKIPHSLVRAISFYLSCCTLRRVSVLLWRREASAATCIRCVLQFRAISFQLWYCTKWWNQVGYSQIDGTDDVMLTFTPVSLRMYSKNGEPNCDVAPTSYTHARAVLRNWWKRK
jgi:hypothetical protein